jgi:hypothetical protein
VGPPLNACNKRCNKVGILSLEARVILAGHRASGDQVADLILAESASHRAYVRLPGVILGADDQVSAGANLFAPCFGTGRRGRYRSVNITSRLNMTQSRKEYL